MYTKQGIQKYDQLLDNSVESSVNDMEGIAEDMLRDAAKSGVKVDVDPKTLKHTMATDLKEHVPPQIFSVVSGIIDLINTLEEE